MRDHPSIGLVLSKEKNKVVVEHALRDTKKPIGLSAYRVLRIRDASLAQAGAAAVAPVAFPTGTSSPTRATKRGQRSRMLPTKLA